MGQVEIESLVFFWIYVLRLQLVFWVFVLYFFVFCLLFQNGGRLDGDCGEIAGLDVSCEYAENGG